MHSRTFALASTSTARVGREPNRVFGAGFATAVTAAALLLPAFLANPAFATMPISEDDLRSVQPPMTGPRGSGVVWPEGRINYLFEMDQIAQFLDAWQVKDVGSPDFGGMIEAEAGPLGTVVQTDNTLEAIWFWSRYTELTGRTTYLQNIADAWVYCETYPAWLEEGPLFGYYRAHNCAWALTAESAYRAATGDDSFLTHAETAADWLVAHPLFLNINQKINALVQGWTSGNLYLYGEEMGRSDWMSAAVTMGNAVWTDYISIDPPTLLATETWAMSSGTMVWGLCNSVYRDDPSAGELWIQQYGAMVDTFQTWYDNAGDSYDWDNSWNVAYVNAQYAMSEVSGDPSWAENGRNLARLLLSYDTDDDGGIPATTQDPVTEDMSWVSSYLGKFGVNRLVGTPANIDAGVLSFVSPTDGATFDLGNPIPIQVEVSNFGLDDLTNVNVTLTGPVGGSTAVDLSFVEKQVIEFDPGWIPSSGGTFEFTCTVQVAGDGDASNDALTIQIEVLDPAAIPDGDAASGSLFLRAPEPNPTSGTTALVLTLNENERAQVQVTSADGRVVRSMALPAGDARIERLEWDGRDADGRELPAGVYFIRAQSDRRDSHTQVVRLR